MPLYVCLYVGTSVLYTNSADHNGDRPHPIYMTNATLRQSADAANEKKHVKYENAPCTLIQNKACLN